MKSIKYPTIKKAFTSKKYGKNFSLSEFYYYNLTFFNKLSLTVIFTLVCLILSFKWRFFLHLSITITITLFYYYHKTRKIVQGIYLDRKAPEQSKEMEEIAVIYQITNKSPFLISNILLFDQFEGNKEVYDFIPINEKILPYSRYQFDKKYLLDGGMGVKTFKNLKATLSDPLNFFQFTIMENREDTINVFPLVEKIKPVKLKNQLNSIHFGQYDVRTRGDSTNFIGTREYREGDPIKRVNWKLSLREFKLIVNEFEKNSNANISILLNMCNDLQVGESYASTWEVTKDLSLSIASLEIERQNAVQLITNDGYVDLNTGLDHLTFMEMTLCHTEPCIDQNAGDFVKKSIDKIPHQSVIYYITPSFDNPIYDQNLKALKKIRMTGHQIFVFSISCFNISIKKLQDDFRSTLIGAQVSTNKSLEKWKEEMKKIGIHFFHFEYNDKVPFPKIIEQLLRKEIEIE